MVDGRWTKTVDHHRADGIKPHHPEAMPVLGTLTIRPQPDDLQAWYDTLQFDDVPF